MHNKPLIHSSPIAENLYRNFSTSDFTSEQLTSDQCKLNPVETIVQRNLSAPPLSVETFPSSDLQQEFHPNPKRQKNQMRRDDLPLKKRYFDFSTTTAPSRKRAKLQHDNSHEIPPSSGGEKLDTCNSSVKVGLDNSIHQRMSIETLLLESSTVAEPAPHDKFATSRSRMSIDTLLSESSTVIEPAPHDFAASRNPLIKKKSKYRRSQPLSGNQRILQEISSLEKIEKSLPFEKQPDNDNCYFTAVTKEYFYVLPYTLQFQSVKTLTGKFIPHLIPEEASDELRKNLATAKSIISYVHNAVPFSSNYFERSKLFTPNYYDQNCLLPLKGVISTSLDLVREKNSSDKSLKSNVEKIIKYKTGNCDEMSKVGYYVARDNAPVEIVKIRGGDHIFLIIGRNQASQLSDYKNWGSQAAICDVWTGAYYPASEIEKYLLDYVELMRWDNMQWTVVRNFNPAIQTIAKKKLPKSN
jgi:hypothetical protein